MSDLLVIQGLDDARAREVLRDWSRSRPWARSIDFRTRWEPRELEINGRNAIRHTRGAHAAEFAGLVQHIEAAGGRIVRVSLRGNERSEADLGEWARKQLAT